MIIPCPNSITCPDTENPLSNYSSEDPDPPIFIRVPTGGGRLNLFGGGAGGPIPVPDGAPTAENMTYQSTYGCVGDPYLQLFNFGGIQPITFDVVDGIIPSWIAADVTGPTLMLTGTPTKFDTGTSSFTIKATDAIGEIETRQFSSDILGLETNTTLPQFNNSTGYSSQLIAGGGEGGYTFGITTGALPSGLTLSNTGLISGTPTVASGAFPFTLSITDQAGRRCSASMQFATNVNCISTVTPALNAAYVGNFYQAAYANVTGKVWCISSATFTDLLEVNPTNGAILNTIAIPGATSIDCVFYENINKLIYVAYEVAGNVWISSVDPITRTITHTVNTVIAVGLNSPRVATYDPTRNKVWFGGQTTIFVLSVSGFSVATIVNGVNPFAGGLVYCSLTDVVIAMGNMQFTGNSAVIQINPGTLATTTVDINADNGNTFGAVYCPENNRVYSPSAPGTKVFVINPNSINGGTFITVANQPIGGIYNACTNRVQIVGVTAGNVFCDYINPDTGLVTAHVATANNYPSFVDPTQAFFDSDNARVWFGCKTALLKFT